MGGTRKRKSPPFVMLYHKWMDTPAWHDLGGSAVKLLVYIVRCYTGENNGAIMLSSRQASDATGLARNTVDAAFRELIDHGFIALVQAGHFDMKVKHSSSWRLTFWPTERKQASHDYLEWGKNAGAISEPRRA